jgi:hypothetical protein
MLLRCQCVLNIAVLNIAIAVFVAGTAAQAVS